MNSLILHYCCSSPGNLFCLFERLSITRFKLPGSIELMTMTGEKSRWRWLSPALHEEPCSPTFKLGVMVDLCSIPSSLQLPNAEILLQKYSFQPFLSRV